MSNTSNTTVARVRMKLEDTQARREQTVREREDAKLAVEERTARLKALRLAKEAAEAAEDPAGDEPAVDNEWPWRLPQAHRR